MIDSLKIFTPELFLSVVSLLVLGVDACCSDRARKINLWIGVVSLVAASVWVTWSGSRGRAFGMVVTDDFAVFFKLIAMGGCALALMLSENDEGLMARHAGSYVSLLLMSTVGILFLSSAEDLLMVFIALELTSLPLFVLVGFTRGEMRSSEGAIKFFLMSAFSAGLMLYGMSLLYGLIGSTHFSAVREWVVAASDPGSNIIFVLGVLFLIVGLGFKMSLAPFHQWVPDTYHGAPTPVTAFLSAAREGGGIVVLLRFFGEFANHSTIGLTRYFFVISVLTMTVGNLTALRQDNLKRILAYSSIAHAGTIFIGLIAGSRLGREGVMLYSLAYFLMSLGAFAVVAIVSRSRGSDELTAVRGLAKENLPLALLMVFFLFSLSGLPPSLGFWGKFYVFASAIESRMYWLAGIGLMNSVIAVYYYFRIARAMFFDPRPENAAYSQTGAGLSIQTATIFCAVFLLAFGLFPEGLILLIKNSSTLMP